MAAKDRSHSSGTAGAVCEPSRQASLNSTSVSLSRANRGNLCTRAKPCSPSVLVRVAGRVPLRQSNEGLRREEITVSMTIRLFVRTVCILTRSEGRCADPSSSSVLVACLRRNLAHIAKCSAPDRTDRQTRSDLRSDLPSHESWDGGGGRDRACRWLPRISSHKSGEGDTCGESKLGPPAADRPPPKREDSDAFLEDWLTCTLGSKRSTSPPACRDTSTIQSYLDRCAEQSCMIIKYP